MIYRIDLCLQLQGFFFGFMCVGGYAQVNIQNDYAAKYDLIHIMLYLSWLYLTLKLCVDSSHYLVS